jgi:His-Xaa-Ser system radical SAM maturase HxsC
MLTLSGRVIKNSLSAGSSGSKLYSLSTNSNLPSVLRGKKAFLIKDTGYVPAGFDHYFHLEGVQVTLPAPEKTTWLGKEFSYFDNDDVVSLGNNRIRSIFRAGSEHNSILLTEQCNNYCLMCSQPPKKGDDSWLLKQAFEAIRLIPRKTNVLGFTGGEPTVYGQEFVNLIQHTKNWLPYTSLHILSNGRSFANENFAYEYARVNHPDSMVGIPIYSADPSIHDYVVQAEGAFDETIHGVLNLKKFKQKVEIRVVLHKQTYKGLAELATFIARNLLFVDQVALMGLEHTGFTRANIDSLWIDPFEYKEELSDAVRILSSYGITSAVYNHPLCLVNSDVYPSYVKAISDWKNEFPPECEPCSRKSDCGGLFSSGIKNGYSHSIKPFR